MQLLVCCVRRYFAMLMVLVRLMAWETILPKYTEAFVNGVTCLDYWPFFIKRCVLQIYFRLSTSNQLSLMWNICFYLAQSVNV